MSSVIDAVGKHTTLEPGPRLNIVISSTDLIFLFNYTNENEKQYSSINQIAEANLVDDSPDLTNQLCTLLCELWKIKKERLVVLIYVDTRKVVDGAMTVSDTAFALMHGMHGMHGV
jgi:hypothetical protein